jgi:hypothetical protein|tara:strand:- start:134 stop:511 length:378 start_codon:yes stop_codon:yes gene_type:complete
MNKGYTDALEDGRQIYIPDWSATIQFENLTQVCKILGQDNVIAIATDKNVPAAMLAVMNAEDNKEATEIVMWCVQQARIDGEKILPSTLNSLGMATIIEVFAHVLHSQYSDFFVSGLAKAHSQSK